MLFLRKPYGLSVVSVRCSREPVRVVFDLASRGTLVGLASVPIVGRGMEGRLPGCAAEFLPDEAPDTVAVLDRVTGAVLGRVAGAVLVAGEIRVVGATVVDGADVPGRVPGRTLGVTGLG